MVYYQTNPKTENYNIRGISALSNHNKPRSTYILEASFNNSNIILTKVNVKAFMMNVVSFFGWADVTHISTHKSEKYGWSSWVVLSDNSAIHFYAWDEDSPYFISIDFCFMKFEIDEKKIISYINNRSMEVVDISFRKKSSSISYKNKIRNDIFRKRVWYQHDVNGKCMSLIDFFNKLSDAIKMKIIKKLDFQKNIFWLHWETSGCIGFFDNGEVYFELYSCKMFCENDVSNLIKSYFSINSVKYGVF